MMVDTPEAGLSRDGILTLKRSPFHREKSLCVEGSDLQRGHMPHCYLVVQTASQTTNLATPPPSKLDSDITNPIAQTASFPES